MGEEAPAKNGAARILDAAVRLFGRSGIASTSLKSIAVEAGVSQALIIHHFGTKNGLRRACDAHVNRLIRERKEAAIDEGPQLDPLFGLRLMADGRDLMRYLVRTLTEGGDGVDEFIDDMVADAEVYMAHGVEVGTFRPSAVPRERVVMLTLWSVGALVLHEHLDRLLGVDLLAEDYGPAGLAPYIRPALELFADGLLADGAYEELTRAFVDAAPAGPAAPVGPAGPGPADTAPADTADIRPDQKD